MKLPAADPRNWAEEYLMSRPDFDRMMKLGYTADHYLDIAQLERDVDEVPFTLSNAEYQLLIKGKPMDEIREIAEQVWHRRFASNPDDIKSRSIEVLAQIDNNPVAAIQQLNQELQAFAVEPGDEDCDDFVLPRFTIRNALRYAREINEIDFEQDAGSLVQLKGVLLYLSDPVQFEYVSRSYMCSKCGEHSVSPHELKQCEYCGCRNIVFDEEDVGTKTRNFQEAILQEHVEDLSGTPASVSVRFFGLDINRRVIGDRLTVVGVVNARKIERRDTKKYEIDVLSACESESSAITITSEDMKEIREMASRPHALDKLSEMFVPEIIGYEHVKKGIILQAAGGVTREHSSFSVRGRIHILLAGDPGKAKSQFLIAHQSIHEKSLYISDTSKAGITAAVSEVAGKKVMVPGILVLANGGVACVDELDKMQKEDREGMHTAMEQGTISKSKAGIRAIFRADTSVLAAANPVNGRFDLEQDIPEQLKIEPTLMDRFDLIFWFVDSNSGNHDHDIKLALRILRPGAKGNPVFLKKYLKTAAANSPSMTSEVEGLIANQWAEIRQRSSNASSVGVRHLQALVRLATASAKLRFSEKIEEQDVDIAVSMMSYSWDPIGYDMDRLAGYGKSIFDAIRFLMNTLKGNNSGATYDELMTHASMIGIETDTLNEAIQKMKNSGQLFEPRAKIYKVIS